MKKATVKVKAEEIEMPAHQLMYVPVLKGKAGEFGALSELQPAIKSKIIPIIEIPEVPWDFIKETYAKSITQHVTDFEQKLIDSWGGHYPIIVDAYLIDDKMEAGNMVIDHILSALNNASIIAIPVVRFEDSDEYLKVIKDYSATNKRVCLRITSDDISDKDLAQAFAELFKKINRTYKDTDLLLDFKDLRAEQEKIYANLAKMSINNIPDIDKFHTLTVAMTSFPENLSEHSADSMVAIPRVEWNIWQSLKAANLKRHPIFADYGISSSAVPTIDPRIMQMSASIRYTHKNTWVIVKGKGVKKHTFEQFYGLSKKLIGSAFFYGEDFSWGDKQIHQKSNKAGGTGNATTWRQIGTNHHISAVVQEISASAGS